MKALGDLIGVLTYALIGAVGIASFTYPFWSPASSDAGAVAPTFVVALIALCVIAMLFDAQTQRLNAKSIALLGVIVALNSALRFIEVSLPGPGGFTPVFFLVILCGATFGPRFGFLTGALTLLVSAFVTAGVGPWLPFQMFAAGWMGLCAGWLGKLIDRLPARAQLLALIAFGAAWGFAYGAIMNLWSWPYALPAAQRAAGFSALATQYAAYYATTSFVWDVFGALGNALLIGLFGAAALRTLQRFKQRFEFVQVATDVREPHGVMP
jgi:energy-coupling factor transport system substrate-specific component